MALEKLSRAVAARRGRPVYRRPPAHPLPFFEHRRRHGQALFQPLNYDPEDIPDFQTVDALAAIFPELLEKVMGPFAGIGLEGTYECSTEIVRRLGVIDQLHQSQKWLEENRPA